jgi:hypothetical protein
MTEKKDERCLKSAEGGYNPIPTITAIENSRNTTTNSDGEFNPNIKKKEQENETTTVEKQTKE